MKKHFNQILKNIIVTSFILNLMACVGKPNKNENLVLLELTIPSYSRVKINNIKTNEKKTVKLNYFNGSYLVTHLPEGVYEISNLKPFRDVDLKTNTSYTRFIVVDNCTNFLGKLNILGDLFHSNGQPTEIFWSFDDEQLLNLNSWIYNKIKGKDICFPHEGGIGKYSWKQFKDHFLTP